MGTLTGANATIMMTVGTLFPTPVQLQGFAADDVFDTDDIKEAEILMGVDGKMSSGFVFVPVPQKFHLQADSASCSIFDLVHNTQRALRDNLTWNAIISLDTIGTSWVMANGVMTSYNPAPGVKKLLQPRTFEITWESSTPAPTGT